MQTKLRHQQLQSPVLILQRLQPLRFAHVHTAELLLPAKECRRADPVLPAHIRRLHSSLALLQIPITCSSVYQLFILSSPAFKFMRELQLQMVEITGEKVRTGLEFAPILSSHSGFRANPLAAWIVIAGTSIRSPLDIQDWPAKAWKHQQSSACTSAS